MQAYNESLKKLLALFDRKEFVAGLVVAALLLFALSDVPGKFGVEAPRAELFGVAQVALASFFANVVEGKFKPSFDGAWRYLFASTKFRVVLLTLFAVLANTALKAFSISLPPEVIQSAVNFAALTVLAVGGADVYRVLNE